MFSGRYTYGAIRELLDDFQLALDQLERVVRGVSALVENFRQPYAYTTVTRSEEYACSRSKWGDT